MSIIEGGCTIPCQLGGNTNESPSSDLETGQQLGVPMWEQPGFNVDQALEEIFERILGKNDNPAAAGLTSLSPPPEPILPKTIINPIPAVSPQPAQELMRRRSAQELAANTRFMEKKAEQIQQRLLKPDPVTRQASCLGRIEQMSAPSCPEAPMGPGEEDGPTLPQPANLTPKPSSPIQTLQDQGLERNDGTV